MRPPGPGTFWGTHVQASPFPAGLSFVVLALTALGLVNALAPDLAAVPGPLRELLVPVLYGAAALIAMLVALFAWASWFARGSAMALLLGAALPGAAVAGFLASLARWHAVTALAPDVGLGLDAAGLGARLTLGLGLQLAWAGAWLERIGGGPQERRLAPAALLKLGGIVLGVGLAGLRVAPAWGDASVLLLLLAAMIPVAQLHRREPGLMTHAALLSLVPQCAAQLAALASASAFDQAALMAQALGVLGFLSLLAGVFLDFHGTARANARFHDRLQLLDLAIQRMSLGVTITDPAGTILYVNPADAAMHGYKPEELVGQRSRIFGLEETNPAERPEVPAFWRRESINRTRDGRTFPVRLISDTVLDEEGRPRAFVTLCEDVSEMRQVQERVERLKRDFLATVSHELRTPITSMLGALGLLRGTRLAAQPERVEELLEIAERNGSRLLLLVNDLLDLQRLEEGALRFQMAPLRLGPLLDESVRGIKGFADLYKVSLRVETDASGASLVTDRDRLAQVLYNLLSNAIKFSPAGREVLLTGRVEDGHVEILVRDHGTGIPEEFRSRLFEKFAQAEDPQTRRQGGSGLGLSISKKLIEGLGGTIAVASSPGAGTTVTVRLPRQAGGGRS